MATVILLELLTVFMIIPVCYSAVRLAKLFLEPTTPDDRELERLFGLYWDGTPEDKLYAWYKVRYILRNREYDCQKLEAVNRRIDNLDRRELCGSMQVNAEGELIDERETGSRIM